MTIRLISENHSIIILTRAALILVLLVSTTGLILLALLHVLVKIALIPTCDVSLMHVVALKTNNIKWQGSGKYQVKVLQHFPTIQVT